MGQWLCRSSVTDGSNESKQNIERDTSLQNEEAAGDLLVNEETRIQWQREQGELKRKLIVEDTEPWAIFHSLSEDQEHHTPLKFVGGVDISFIKDDDINACAAFVVITYPELEVVYEDCRMIELTAPYIPGFLAFREAPFLVEMFHDLKKNAPNLVPQIIMVDGNGILHPSEFGLACHLGVLLDTPALGVAKKLFQVDGLEKNQDHKNKIQELKNSGDTFPLVGKSGKVLGLALRSSDTSKNPVYISPGHMVSLETTKWLVHSCCKHRIPEPTRQADLRSREFIRQHIQETKS